ncbi:MAG: hypothetical protein HYV26_17640 [Candidatus Hydrogenedentes bacterium]|nr:hypothetical protein [Candidatus Hydrogenedentota bacterium]
MRLKHWTMLGAILAILGGCIPLSLQPIYTDDVLVCEPRLEGEWKAEEDALTWRFARGEGKSYTVSVKEDETEMEYAGHLVKLGEHYFLDLLVQRAEGLPEGDRLLELQLVPVHLFLRLAFSDAGIQLFVLDFDWLEDRIEQHRLWAPHTQLKALDDYPLFTASPKRMQRFLKRWANHEEAWEDGGLLVRVVPETVSPAA